MKETMGQIIRRLRKERELTQEELAVRLNITSQAVSKWENDTSMPDVSQIVPLASVFGVTTDVLFGIAETTADEEAWQIVNEAESLRQYGRYDTYLAVYETMLDGLRKYPNNLILLNNCMQRGVGLSLTENGWVEDPDRRKQIGDETLRQAELIIALSQSMTEIMTARQILLFLYCNSGDYSKATEAARKFPVRTDFTLYGNMAYVNESMGNHEREIIYLCSDMDYALQAMEDRAARLGKAYMKSGRYTDAVEVFTTYFAVMKTIYGKTFPPYHDFDSGDCYLLLAEAYFALGNTEQAMDAAEESVRYYLRLLKSCPDVQISWAKLQTSPLIRESEVPTFLDRRCLKPKLIKKLRSDVFRPLADHQRFRVLRQEVENLPD